MFYENINHPLYSSQALILYLFSATGQCQGGWIFLGLVKLVRTKLPYWRTAREAEGWESDFCYIIVHQFGTINVALKYLLDKPTYC